MTTPASVAVGRNAVTPGVTSMNTITRAAATMPLNGVRAPASSAMGVRDELPQTGKPPSRPLATLAIPSAPISWLPLVWMPRRPARLLDKAEVSAKAMSAMPAAGPMSPATSSRVMPPRAGAGSPWGRAPTMGMASLRPRAAAAAMDAATASSTPGTFPGRNRPATMMTTVAAPNSSATGFTAPWSTASAVPAAVACNEPPETWMPRSRGSWLTMTASAMPLR